MEESPGISESEADVFKKPAFLPEKSVIKVPVAETVSTGELPTPDENSPDEEKSSELDASIAHKEQNPEPTKSSKLNVPSHPLPYTEPSWGGLPDKFYSLEEMKGGISLRNIPLDSRSFHSFGRLDNCHVVMAHPTTSRYHAVLQFRSTFSNEDEKRGFYLYDLGSTHGTFLNKYRIVPKTYVKVQVGHMIKFGSSTRFFLLHGPDDDQEDESQYSYTQLKEMRKEELQKREADYLQQRAKLLGEGNDDEEEEESKGIDWGMGEDADETTDLKENPFALITNDDMYKDDPKKCLKQWFDREGEELHYRIEEKGFSQFRCTIELPIENAGGGSAMAEAIVSGRKKEAALQCALEACRMLDRAGLLRPSNQESRKRKIKNWEEDDYYDSDEDNFFDRTGDLENKRKQRMKQVHKTQPSTDTYETLIEKHKKLIQEIEEMERKLNTMLVEAGGNEDDENLESFMSQQRSGQVLDKLEFKKIKTGLNRLKTDEEKLRKLINFVKPFELPEIKPPPQRVKEEKPEEKPSIESKNERKIIESEIKHEVEEIPEQTTEIKDEISTESAPSESAPTMKKRVPPKLRNKDRAKKIAESFSNQYEEDFNNIVWAPPTGQTGDGRTNLNDKFGY